MLALLAKNEPGDEVTEDEFGSLVAIGALLRLDFMNWFVKKDPNLAGPDRLSLFGYDAD